LRRRQRGSGKQHEAKFGHDDLDPEMSSGFWALRLKACVTRGLWFGDERTGVRLDCGKGQTRNRIYFLEETRKNTAVHGVFRGWFQTVSSDCPRQFQLSPARSVAGLGVDGLFGPWPGISSGIFPGNSCGCGGAPGSCTGGGISGFGLPGGSSRGGSVGWPGVAGGISGGSIGIVAVPVQRATTAATALCSMESSGKRL
jgi:hypothetical protein